MLTPNFATTPTRPPAHARQACSADFEATGEYEPYTDPPMRAPHGTELSVELLSEARGAGLGAGQPGLDGEQQTRLGRNEAGLCWGGVITGKLSNCTPGFKPGTAHMKNKFCDQCRAGFTIPAERVRALLPEDKDRFDNASASGVWKRSIGVAARYRLINQTLHCRGPKLLIFEGPAPTDHLWGELPATWVWPGGLVRLRTAYGTLVPIETNNFRSRKRWHEDSASAASRGVQSVQQMPTAYPAGPAPPMQPNTLALCTGMNPGYISAPALSWQQAMGHPGVQAGYGEVPAVLVAQHGVAYPGQPAGYAALNGAAPVFVGGQPTAPMSGMAPIVMPAGGAAPATAPIVLQVTPEAATVAPATVIAQAEVAVTPTEPVPVVPEAVAPAPELDSASATPAVVAGPGAVFAAALDAEAAEAEAATAPAQAEVTDSAPGSPTSGQPARDRLLALRTLLTDGLVRRCPHTLLPPPPRRRRRAPHTEPRTPTLPRTPSPPWRHSAAQARTGCPAPQVSETEYEETRQRILANL